MTKSYADQSGNQDQENKKPSEVANDAAKRAEEQVEEIKKEAREDVKHHNKES